MNATSYSDINTYQRCPKKHYYRKVENLQHKKRAVALFDGTNGHEFLKTFFLAKQAGASMQSAWSRVLDHAVDLTLEVGEQMFEEELVDVRKQIDLMLTIIKRYVDQYAEKWEILHVEEEFIVMLDSGEVVSFTPDLVVRDRNGFVWIIDHKTTSRVPEGGIPFGDMQALLYYAGVKALYPECKGFIFNRIRKKLPTQPRLTKTGKTRVADLTRIDTTFEVLRNFLQEKAPGLLSEETHQRRLAQLRDQDDKFFWTEQVYVNDTTVEAILVDTEAVLNQMELSRKTGAYPRNLQEDNGYLSCRKCPFQRICHAEMVGWDTELIRAEEYEPRDPKNPYESEDYGSD